jgi:hypothetical protein
VLTVAVAGRGGSSSRRGRGGQQGRLLQASGVGHKLAAGLGVSLAVVRCLLSVRMRSARLGFLVGLFSLVSSAGLVGRPDHRCNLFFVS